MNPFKFERISINKGITRDFVDSDTIGLEDTFLFSCKGCGKCCKNRDYINLTAYDVYRAAQYLGRTHEEFITQYGTVFQSESLVPTVALTMRAGTCPFLRNKKCAIHQTKPCACRFYPLGREFFPGNASSRFIQNKSNCHHIPQEIAVRDWIGDFSTEEAEQIGWLWSNTYSCISYTLQLSGTYTTAPAKIKKLILRVIFIDMYLNYDTEKPFRAQLEVNAQCIQTTLREMHSICVDKPDDFDKVLKEEVLSSDPRYELEFGINTPF